MLVRAIRQYRHNDEDAFVYGYDKEEVENIIIGLIKEGKGREGKGKESL